MGWKQRSAEPHLLIAVSACVLGESVRYDGKHKRNSTVAGASGVVQYLPVCPEVEIGLGVPREPIDLVRGENGLTRLISSEKGRDLSASMRHYAAEKTRVLASLGIAGCIVQNRSPSCARDDAPILQTSPPRRGAGLFVEVLRARLPELPVASSEELATERDLQAFLDRARTYLMASAPS